MWKTLTTLLVLALVAPEPATAPSARSADAEWSTVSAGVSYLRREVRALPLTEPIVVHAFRFTPARHELRVLPGGEGGAPVHRLAAEAGALLAVNGGFFLEDFSPLGLLVSQGRELNPLRRVDWGVFYVADREARIVHRRDWRRPAGLEFAVEAGPRLVVEGRVLTLKPQRARRTALGITEAGDVLIVATEGRILTAEFAELLARPESAGGLGCRDALNLDGGSSTQLWFEHAGRRIEIEPLANVANAVALFPR